MLPIQLKRQFVLTPEQVKYIDDQVAILRLKAAKQEAGEMPFINRSSWLRDLIDEKMAAQ